MKKMQYIYKNYFALLLKITYNRKSNIFFYVISLILMTSISTDSIGAWTQQNAKSTEKDCAPSVIKSPSVLKLDKGGYNQYELKGEISGFDACSKHVYIQNNDKIYGNKLVILLHGGGTSMGYVDKISKDLFSMGLSTLYFSTWGLNNLEGDPGFSNFDRQRMIFKVAHGAYNWARSNKIYSFKEIYFFGISNGATVAINLAAILPPEVVKGVIAEGPTNGGSGVGLPNKIQVPAQLIFGEADDFAAIRPLKRWNSPALCRMNGLDPAIPQGSAETCNKDISKFNDRSLSTEEWVEKINRFNIPIVGLKIIKHGAHGMGNHRGSPLRIETRAEAARRIGARYAPFMENLGWSTGGTSESEKELMKIIEEFILFPRENNIRKHHIK